MKILFLMLNKHLNQKDTDMYTDLAYEFKKNGHCITIIAPTQTTKSGKYTEYGLDVIRIKTMPLLGVKSAIKKGIGLFKMTSQYKKAYKRYLISENFDWIFLPTPPITLINFVLYVKSNTSAKLYLILRDIHPQSLKSIGALNNPLMYLYLRLKANQAYKNAEIIGCMSRGNISYIKKIVPKIDVNKLKLLYNWFSAIPYSKPSKEIIQIYGIEGKFTALFGGNIGKGQNIYNIINLANYFKDNNNIVFLIIGKGVLKEKLKALVNNKKLKNIRILDFLPRNEYLEIVKSVDLGLISLDEKYTVPTSPSKVLSYMSLKIPVFAMINPENDYGTFIQDEAKAGYWCIGGNKNIENIISIFKKIVSNKDELKKLGENGYKYYYKYLTTTHAYKTIINHMQNYE